MTLIEHRKGAHRCLEKPSVIYDMKHLISFLVILLCLSMLITCLASCGQTSDGPDKDAETKDQDSESQTEEESKTDDRIPLNVPEKEYDRSFTFLHWDVDKGGVGGPWIVWEEIFADKILGDTLNDAIYSRNSVINDTYNVDIVNEYRNIGELNETVKNAHMTGKSDYDAYIQRSVQLNGILTGGYLYNLQNLPYMDLSHPWWSQDSIETLALGNINQFIASDITVLDKSAIACVQYNVTVADQHREAVGNMYEMVKNGTWTFQQFVEICDNVGTDLDNDGKRNGEGDLVAFYCGDDPVHFCYNAAGLRFMEHDENNYFVYKFNSADSIETMTIIYEDLMYADFFRNNVVEKGFTTDKFRANELLFRMGFVKNASQFRDMESDYGILPIPMFSEGQTRFYSEVSPHHDSMMFISDSITDPDFVGAMLEALAWESHYTVQPIFYDVIITGRSVRDAESKEMLSIIFDSRIYDAGLIFDLEGFGGKVLRHTATHTTGFASLWDTYKKPVGEALDKLNTMIAKLNSPSQSED
ncbi:MAG: hypothetical protein II710_03255 [Clostridia bacterium]|nr:hypothetical protein [Clostridia bacterium]